MWLYTSHRVNTRRTLARREMTISRVMDDKPFSPSRQSIELNASDNNDAGGERVADMTRPSNLRENPVPRRPSCLRGFIRRNRPYISIKYHVFAYGVYLRTGLDKVSSASGPASPSRGYAVCTVHCCPPPADFMSATEPINGFLSRSYETLWQCNVRFSISSTRVAVFRAQHYVTSSRNVVSVVRSASETINEPFVDTDKTVSGACCPTAVSTRAFIVPRKSTRGVHFVVCGFQK